ncbi:hypothetical protein SAMN05421869_10512 [Nonomuraea jiangxiensis]|uniref:Uncharacterized protein n=1 Tax=Nonomuraea jiangxiensis TaxID=633440 RepID=A0A1G8JA68_9ACTN|nr:hypothetical protein SAMN05421869_10512 [Nonomuraea jiangxiensis]
MRAIVIEKFGPGGEFPVGAKVAALMGGLGRTINGSYAEYTRVPVSNRGPDRVGPAMGRARGRPGDVRDGLDLPVP